ncbi:MAG: potassium channel family protein [Candidatus Caldarchaeum sp.]
MVSSREVVISSLSVVSIALIIFDYLMELTLDQALSLVAADGLIVSVLAADLFSRARASGSLPRYLAQNWYEVLALLPMALFYVLETQTVVGALMRSFRLFRMIRFGLVVIRTGRTLKRYSDILRRSNLLYLTSFAAAVVFIGTSAAYLLESDLPDSRIRDWSDAFWWALATVTTVGYGDVVPVSVAGRFVGSVLMITGIAVIGVFISTLGSAILTTPRNTGSSTYEEVKNVVKKKLEMVEKLSDRELEELIELIRTLHRLKS